MPQDSDAPDKLGNLIIGYDLSIEERDKIKSMSDEAKGV